MEQVAGVELFDWETKAIVSPKLASIYLNGV